MKTVVGLYNSVAEANKVKATLTTEGYLAEHITVIDQTGSGSDSSSTDYSTTGSTSSTGYSTTGSTGSTGNTGTGIGDKIKNFFSSFSEGDNSNEHEHYASRVGNGGALLAVTVPDNEADETADLLFEHGATGIQGGAQGGSSYAGGTGTRTGGAEDVAVLEGSRDRGTQMNTASNVAGEQVIPVVEEELVVGKRQVDRGGVRIYSHLVERPVSTDVTLRDERVVVDRRPVDRAATAADFETGAGVVELTATGEEAVVGKSSRVVEEVMVGKQASERTEQINDTIRRTEVEVEPTTVTTGTSTTGTSTSGTSGFGTTGTGTTKDRF